MAFSFSISYCRNNELLSATVLLLCMLKPLTAGSLSPGSLGQLSRFRSNMAEWRTFLDVEAVFSSKSGLKSNLRKCSNKSKGKLKKCFPGKVWFKWIFTVKLKLLVKVNNRIVRTANTRLLLYYTVSLQEHLSLFLFLLLTLT